MNIKGKDIFNSKRYEAGSSGLNVEIHFDNYEDYNKFLNWWVLGKQIENMILLPESSHQNLLRKSLDAESIDLDKIGWTESQPDKKIFSYIRGYIWRSFGIRIKHPMDWIIYYMITESLSENKK